MTFKCLECGRKFRTVKSAYRASLHGCPGCGGVDVDLDTEKSPALRLKVAVRKVPAPQPGKAPPQPHDGYHGEERDPLRPALSGPCRPCDGRPGYHHGADETCEKCR